MLPTQRTALVEMTRWSMICIASAPPRPQRVDDGLHVLLVHDQVVGAGAVREQPVGLARGVGQRHASGRARPRRLPAANARARPARCSAPIRSSRPARSVAAWMSARRPSIRPVDVRQPALLGPDQVGEVAAVAPQVAAARRRRRWSRTARRRARRTSGTASRHLRRTLAVLRPIAGSVGNRVLERR